MSHLPPFVNRLASPLLVLSLLAAACSDDIDTSTSTSTSSAPDTTTTDATTTTTTATTTVPATTPIPDDDLPGDPFDIAPATDRTIAVVGVRFDDVLNVRRAPGTDNEIVAALAPTSADAVATGRARALASSIWWEVTTSDGVVGWVGSSFTAQLGPTTDTTAEVVAFIGSIPEATAIADLGRLVAETFDTDPDIPSEIVEVVQGDETGDLAEVTFDLIGLGDDAVRGIRLHVFGQPADAGDGFGLKSVEATDLCDPTRGPSEPLGICA